MRAIFGLPAMALAGGVIYLVSVPTPAPAQPIQDGPAPGRLTPVGKEALPMPLERTDVRAEVDGPGATVTVRQRFRNPSRTAIEAIYTFPLPHDAAVDRMTMRVGSRTVEGRIERRADARMIYNTARQAGQAAALLDQERPNLFTQSVANIAPGATVEIEIRYVQRVAFVDGHYEFTFPMAVGPRFTGNAPDPDRISPPILPPNVRSGQTIGLDLEIRAGSPIVASESLLHRVNESRIEGGARVRLANQREIPNRDFVYRYRVAESGVQPTFTSHFDPKRGGFFSLGLVPPPRPAESLAAPREMIFVIDQSGSQSGLPIQKSKELTLRMLDSLRPDDTFNVIAFSNVASALFDAPVRPTESTLARARQHVRTLEANGGTQLREGVIAAFSRPADPKRLRMVVFNTDGYVGDERACLETLRQYRSQSRMFTFGIGNGVNRYLLDALALEGRGATETVTLNADPDAVLNRFLRRTRTPLLTDVTVQFIGVDVTDAQPAIGAIPDVFDESPIVLTGRYATPGRGRAILRGTYAGQPWVREVELNFSSRAESPSTPTLWARQKVATLEMQASGNGLESATSADIERIALEFGIMSAATSFVAVEPTVVNVGGKSYRVRVPVEMVDGVTMGLDGVNELSQAKSANRYFNRPAMGAGGITASPSVAMPMDERDFALAPPTASKLDPELKLAKGKVPIMVEVDDLEPSTLRALERIGFKLAAKSSRARIVFGTIDASRLDALAKLEKVSKVRLLKD